MAFTNQMNIKKIPDWQYKYINSSCKLNKLNKGIIHDKSLFLISPCNSVGGNIVMRPFVCGLVSEWVREWVHLSRFAFCKWAQYRLQFLPDHFQTSHVSCWWWKKEFYWHWVIRSNRQLFFQSLSNFIIICLLVMMRGGTLLILGCLVKDQGRL